MILVIDNYDSFTWNLVHYLREIGTVASEHGHRLLRNFIELAKRSQR